MESDKEVKKKIGKNKVYNVLGARPNVRWCDQEKKSRIHMREEHSGQREQMPAGGMCLCS